MLSFNKLKLLLHRQACGGTPWHTFLQVIIIYYNNNIPRILSVGFANIFIQQHRHAHVMFGLVIYVNCYGSGQETSINSILTWQRERR